MSRDAPRRIGLQLKIVLGLLVITMVPLMVSAYLIDEIAEVSENYASNAQARFRIPLERAAPIYRQLIATKKAYYLQTAWRYANSPKLAELVRSGRIRDADFELDEILRQVPELYRIVVVGADGSTLAERVQHTPAGVGERYRALQPDILPPIDDTGARLQLTFAADLDLRQELEDLGKVLDTFRQVDRMRSSLPQGYRRSFLVVVGGVVLLVTGAGILLARRMTKRIALLVDSTRQVAAGDLRARVPFEGRDELGELANAFNRMVEDLERDRDQISYLQRVGAWQEVARKLAHEIKNPLTPIQLAVQQCVSSYSGDDPRYRKLLADAEEIVGEEIASLRRLVDAFRSLGQLPKVEAEALDLAIVVEDLTKMPEFAPLLRIEPPAEPVMVRGDRMLLRRVLTNLVENGSHAGKDAGGDGEVVVAWRAGVVSGKAVLTVDDQGPGITVAERERIFEPYVTSKEIGTGLGLAISKKIALEHGGRLEVADKAAPTGGARFELTLPLASAEEVGRAGRG